MIKLKKIQKEMAHVQYGRTILPDFSNKFIDFRFEKYDISKEEKQRILQSFWHKGVLAKIGFNKYIKFTSTGISVVVGNKSKLPILPKDWKKYIIIIGEQYNEKKWIERND